VFLSVDDPEHEFALRQSADQITGKIQTLIAKAIADVQPAPSFVSVISVYPPVFFSRLTWCACVTLGQNPLKRVFDLVARAIWPGPGPASREFLRAMVQSGRSAADVLATVLGYALCSSVSYAHGA
jgi:hypothetical protein